MRKAVANVCTPGRSVSLTTDVLLGTINPRPLNFAVGLGISGSMWSSGISDEGFSAACCTAVRVELRVAKGLRTIVGRGETGKCGEVSGGWAAQPPARDGARLLVFTSSQETKWRLLGMVPMWLDLCYLRF